MACPSCDGTSEHMSLIGVEDFLDTDIMADISKDYDIDNIFVSEFYERVFQSISTVTTQHTVSRVTALVNSGSPLFKDVPKYILYDSKLYNYPPNELTAYLVDENPLVREYAERLVKRNLEKKEYDK